MAVKFSAFTTRTGTLDASTKIVGYDDPAGTKTNVEFSLATLVANSGIYGADGTIGTTRKALITDTLQFRNAGDTKDVFKLNTNGAFALGLDAANTSETNVCIGIEAATPSVYGVAIGRKTSIGGTASYATAIGNEASTNSAQSVVVGAYSTVGFKGTTLGYSAGSTANYAINIGYGAEGSGASSITLNANSGSAMPSTANAFGVYMTSNTTPDFEVVGGGTSTLNTNFKITGIGAAGDYIIKNAGNDADAYTVYMTDGTGQANVGAYGGINFISRYGSIGSTANYNNLGVWTFERNVVIKGQAYTELHTGATPADPDWDDGNVQEMTLASLDQDFDPSNSKAGATYILKIKQPSSGAAGTINWNAASATVKWPAGTPPTLSTANNAEDIVTLICVVGAVSGGTYYGNATLNFS